MSRVERENELVMAAFGADFPTGSFLQIWQQPHTDQDEPVIHIDNMGVRVREPAFEMFEPRFMRKIHKVFLRFEQARYSGNLHPNIDAETVGDLLQSLGFEPGITQEVYRAFD